MNEDKERLLKLLEQASKALSKTQEKLEKAEGVVANWDSATNNPVENKTLDEWEQEVAELKVKEKMLVQEVKEARAAFMAIVPQCNLFSQRSLHYSRG
jgi:predicted 2-oxoglutarate/Fe(II)-dependent dioxygenase YbiX